MPTEQEIASREQLSCEIEVTPAFYDIDVMEIVYHGNYVRYLELARSALLAQFDYDYPRMRDSGYGWPVVDMRLKYVRPALFGQKLKIRATITEWENRLRIDYVMRDAATGVAPARLIARAVTILNVEPGAYWPSVAVE